MKTTKISRRDFLKTSAFLGGGLLLSSCSKFMPKRESAQYDLVKPENAIYTSCLQFNTGCGIKVKSDDGVAVKIDGNPFNPYNLVPHLDYKTDIKVTANIDAPICPKGQAGMQTVYDPFRLKKVLKRTGKRGENKWKTISFEQAISEVVEGGLLFKDVAGEENRKVEGLKDIYVLRDKDIMKKMSKAVDHMRHEKDKDKKKALIEEFKVEFKDTLNTLIDPNHPDFGPKNNQFVFMWGRLKSGRNEFIRKFIGDAFGSTNAHGHTTVCQGSLYFTGKAMSEQWKHDEKENKVKWTGGDKFYWQVELENTEFVVFVGANVFDANYGPTNRMSRLMDGVSKGKTKYAVIDPRFSKAASKADKWIPIKPGEDGAFALGVIRWMIENKMINTAYLENANKGTSKKNKEPNWCNSSWLVKIEKGEPKEFLRGEDIGVLPLKKQFTDKDKTVKDYDYSKFVILKSGQPVAFDPNGDEDDAKGDLFASAELNGKTVKTVLQIIKEEAFSKTLEEWAKIADVKAADIVYIARNLTSHGRKAGADIHRGVSQHTNGFYNVCCWNTVNALIGNYDYKGGFIKASTYNYMGDKTGKVKNAEGKEEEKGDQPFDIKKLTSGPLAPFGISIIRHDCKYEESTIFSGYPAKRPWFPISSDVYQEILPSAGAAYPYPIKALVLYMGNPIYSLPAGDKNVDILKDVNKLPLYINIDITVGETSMFADYIFPDLTYLERWEFQGSHPNMPFKVQPVRQPAIAPIPETVKVFGEEYPISLEAFILGVSEKLKLKGFGVDGFGKGLPFTHPDHMYLRMAANIAAEGSLENKDVPEASASEVEIFLQARKHLPKCVFDYDRWKKIVGNEWIKKVIYVLNRGGRFENYDKTWDGETVKNKYSKLINLYQEKTSKVKNAMNGKSLKGYAHYIPPYRDVANNPIEDEKEGYNLTLVTSRYITQTKSRTVTNYWLNAILPENFIYMNEVDAKNSGFKDGQKVKVISKSNPDGVWDLGKFKKEMIGKIKIGQEIRPGVVNFYLGFGHWASGAGNIEVDGAVIKGDTRRAQGVHANAAMRADPILKDTALQDVYGGSIVFYSSKVKLVRA